MKQELIDLILGELETGRAHALEARLAKDPALARELKELEALLGLMRRGEEIEPSAAMDRAVLAAAARSCRPSPAERLRQIPGLFRFRFRRSVAFRAAAVALVAHLIAMAVLYQVYVKRAGASGAVPFVVPQPELLAHEPSTSFVRRLELRRLPHHNRLKRYGVAGQQEAIRKGIDALLASQRPDGSFGSPAATATGALALLSEGDCSVSGTRKGEAIQAAIRHLLAAAREGAGSGAILAALVEDYALSYESLPNETRSEYARAIFALIQRVDADEFGQEALVLAQLAGFGVPAGRDLGPAALLLGGDRGRLLGRKASRLSATVVLARGPHTLDRDRVRDWARPLFAEAVAEISAGKVSGVVLLALQAPYRL